MRLTEQINDTLTVPEIARLSGYARSTIGYRIDRGFIEAARDANGIKRVPISELTKLARRDKFERTPAPRRNV